jgi:polyisoprenoid-binding protein YceI
MMTTAALAALTLAGCDRPAAPAAKAPGPAADTAAKPASAAGLPAGAYKIDPTHTTVLFKVNHLGFSQYTGAFKTVTADLQLDPANPSTARLTATIDPTSLDIPAPPAGFLDELKGAQWLNAAQFPQITFRSTAVKSTGADTADITGDLTLHGVTKPVTLKAKFNGGYAGHPMDPSARIGFSATGSFKRSEFGIAYGVPAPGTTMGVGDEVAVIVETEFTGPPLPGAPAAQAH